MKKRLRLAYWVNIVTLLSHLAVLNEELPEGQGGERWKRAKGDNCWWKTLDFG